MTRKKEIYNKIYDVAEELDEYLGGSCLADELFKIAETFLKIKKTK